MRRTMQRDRMPKRQPLMGQTDRPCRDGKARFLLGGREDDTDAMFRQGAAGVAPFPRVPGGLPFPVIVNRRKAALGFRLPYLNAARELHVSENFGFPAKWK
jgi:hypothetical protein